MDTSVEQFRNALAQLTVTPGRVGFAIVTPDRRDLAGNIAAALDGATAEISYWLAADARARASPLEPRVSCAERWPVRWYKLDLR